ncbi:hypothetical protein V2O64_07300 [Verrucomicrobiaceae bacterium 227]
MKKTTAFLILTHGGAAVMGWALVGHGMTSKRADPYLDEGTLPRFELQERRARRSHGSRGAADSEEFRSVWDSLPDQQLSREDRIKAQRRILEDWALVDLEGAMKAMLGESWWEGPRSRMMEGQLEGPFAPVFAKAFAADPDGSWELITSGELGVGANMLRHVWCRVMQANPLMLAGKLAEVPASELKTVLDSLAHADLDGPGVRAGVVKALTKLPESKISMRDIMRFLPEISRDEAASNFRAVTDFSTREGELALYQYGQRHFFDEKLEWVRSYDEGKLAEMKTVVDRLPHETQGKFIYGLIAGGFEHEFLVGRGDRTVDLLNLMVEGEHWETLERAQSLQQVSAGLGMTAEARAAWAVGLPQKEEAAEVFEYSIRPYIQGHHEESWDWIQKFPEGMWRERALVQYADILGSLHEFEATRRAIGEIRDPEARKVAEENYALYENAGR